MAPVTLKYPTKIVDIKSTSSAVWWIKNPSATVWRKQQKQSLGISFCQDMTQLLNNIAIHGYNKLASSQFNVWEKLIWFAMHMTTLCGMVLVLSITWHQFVTQNFAISLHDPLYPVENVPFPAVSICSNNRISRQAAVQYAQKLSRLDPGNRTYEYFLKFIGGFTHMYYKFGVDSTNENYDRFQKFLDVYDTWNNETFYNTKRVMLELTPSCENYLLKCSVFGKKVNCMSNISFSQMMTSYGPCCTFNMNNIYRKRARLQSMDHPENGLTVTLNTSQRDLFSPILNIYGSLVIIHESGKYPDTTSGGCPIVFPSYGEESFISIKARIIDTDVTLRKFSSKTRNCYFDNEVKESNILLDGTYSFTNCITRCRINSILALCKCLPFYMPMDLVDRTDGIIYCTLQHIECLYRYGFKWRNVLTKRGMGPGLEREEEEGIYCVECLPSCDDIQYQVSLMSLPLQSQSVDLVLNVSKPEKQPLEVDEYMVLRIHFEEPHMQYYRRVDVNAWFEALSTVGNILSIFVGFSFVAICELLFFACKYLIKSMQLFVQQNKKPTGKAANQALDASKLYICP